MKRTSTALAVAAASLGIWMAFAQTSGDALERGFQNPPASAKPRVWWHWMSGNITKEGIKADLEWMNRVGIAGFQNFDANLNTPQVVEKRLAFMTPEWKDAFKFTVTLADQLGLEMAIAGSPGWSESGGPWVPPAQAMKKFVWTETWVEGGKPFSGKLPRPSDQVGTFQNLGGGGARAAKPPSPWYADAAVVAFRLPDADKPMAQLQPKITSSGGSFNLAALTDGDYVTSTLLPAAPVERRLGSSSNSRRPKRYTASRCTRAEAADAAAGVAGRVRADRRWRLATMARSSAWWRRSRPARVRSRLRPSRPGSSA